VYDTWSGWIVAAIDARGERCSNESHAIDRVLSKRPRASVDHDVSEQTSRSKSA
jgi:hypothetical protein